MAPMTAVIITANSAPATIDLTTAPGSLRIALGTVLSNIYIIQDDPRVHDHYRANDQASEVDPPIPRHVQAPGKEGRPVAVSAARPHSKARDLNLRRLFRPGQGGASMPSPLALNAGLSCARSETRFTRRPSASTIASDAAGRHGRRRPHQRICALVCLLFAHSRSSADRIRLLASSPKVRSQPCLASSACISFQLSNLPVFARETARRYISSLRLPIACPFPICCPAAAVAKRCR
jgi:hypothetical protein